MQKFVVGCDGYNAVVFAKALRDVKPKTLEEAYRLALSTDFGCDNCLVAMDGARMLHSEDPTDETLAKYRGNFSSAEWIPLRKFCTRSYVYLLRDNIVEKYTHE